MTKATAFGVPRRMPRLARIAAPLTVAGVLIAAPAAARDFCASLRQAMAHAAGDFRALKLPSERASVTPARKLIPGGEHCEVRDAEGSIEYRCRMTRADAAPGEVRAAFRRDVRRLRHCFASLSARGDGDYTGTTEWTGAVIWQPRPGLRAAVVFFAAEDIAFVADDGDPAADDANASWIVVDKRK